MTSRGELSLSLFVHTYGAHTRDDTQSADGKRIDNAAAGGVPPSSDSCAMQPAYNTMEGGRSRWKSPLLLCFFASLLSTLGVCPMGPRIRGEDVDRKALYVQGGIEKEGGEVPARIRHRE